ncbi:MAG: TetR/AcrR family transcriptional regulator [Novosphingobium sp.]|nr:TetR/AcrR family transcriptional regulator [Novosphingobium sp.]MCP5401388.1 TetR/AcrR family transcriptional regulator [Novosphingobium sp.]
MASLADCPKSRREARRESRRDAILQVASDSFLKCGYADTTMSEIAATLGGSKGTLWNYFPSKELLFNAVLDRLTRDFRAQLTVILNTRGDVETTLRRFCEEFLRKVTAPESIALYRLVISEANRFPEVGRVFYDRGPQATRQQLADYLSVAMEGGMLRKADCLRAAGQLIGLCLGGSHQRLLVGAIDRVERGQLDEDIDRAMEIFMRGYAP